MYRAGGPHPRIAVGQDALSETKRHESAPENEPIGNMIGRFSLRCGDEVLPHVFILRRSAMDEAGAGGIALHVIHRIDT